MKTLLTLSTFAALPLCLLAESDKTLIPGTLPPKQTGPVSAEEVAELRKRAALLSEDIRKQQNELDEIQATIETFSDHRKLAGRSGDYAIVGPNIDEILKNSNIGVGTSKLPADFERELNDGGIGYGANQKHQPDLKETFQAIEAVINAQTITTEEDAKAPNSKLPWNKPIDGKPLKPLVQPNGLRVINGNAVCHELVNGIFFDTTQPGWKPLTKEDFTKVNSADDTWKWEDDMLRCTGQPVSVMRTVKEYKNFEMVVEWRHNKPAGNSGVFVWATPESIEKLTKAGKPGLPSGIEVQVLDNGYTDKVAKKGGKTDWFTTHGDVFPVRVKMKPIGKTSPNGSRSFPRKDLSKDHGNWNHYYIRAVNGEVRLWVNGQEVSGGTECDPAQGYLCLESEGSPIDFRNLHIRELP